MKVKENNFTIKAKALQGVEPMNRSLNSLLVNSLSLRHYLIENRRREMLNVGKKQKYSLATIL